MSFRISGLPRETFSHLLDASDETIEATGARIVVARTKPGFPCRITLEDAEPGEEVILLNHESHKAATPYRSVYAIFVRRAAKAAPTYLGALPPVMESRPIALRMFDGDGMLIAADMGRGDDLVQKINAAFSRDDIAYIHAHNAMHGCFAAEILRA